MHPILISPTNTPHYQVTKIFRFESAWHIDSSYYDYLKNNWDLNAPITTNLKILQNRIMRWKLSTFDHVRKMKGELTARLGGIQRSIQSGNRHSGLVMLEGNLQRELGVIVKKKKIIT